MKFDLERAKVGDVIEYKEAYGWTPVRFIGEWKGDCVVCEVPWNDKPEIVSTFLMRMAEKKVTLVYRVCILKSDESYTTSTVTNNVAEHAVQARESFVCWLTDWIEAEVPQGENK